MLNYKPTEQDKLYAAFCKGYETAHKHFVTNKTPIMEQQTLTKEEAIKALIEGKKLSHRYFDSWEWIRQEGFTMIMEDGASIDTDTFWKDRDSTGFLDGWYIKEEPQDTNTKKLSVSVEDAALKVIPDKSTAGWIDGWSATERIGFIKGVKWQKEQTKLLEDSHKELLEALKKLYNSIDSCIDLTHEILLKSKLAIETANKLTIK